MSAGKESDGVSSGHAAEAQLAAAIAAARKLLEATEQAVAAEPSVEARASVKHARRLYQERVWALALTAEPIVRHLARRFRGVGDSTEEDLRSVGLEGLFVAAEKFDPSRRIRFATVARWWARSAISRAAHHDRRVRLPEGWNELMMRLARLPGGLSVPELSKAMGTSPERVAHLLFWTAEPFLFLDETGGADPQGSALEDKTVSETTWTQALDDARCLEPALQHLQRLPPRTKHVVVRCLGLDGKPPQNLQQIGDDLGLSRERARQIFRDAILTLQEQLPASLRRQP